MKPLKVVERLEVAIGIEGPPVPLRTAIESVLVADFAYLPIQAAERAEGLQEAVSRVIAQRASAHEGAGTLPVLTLIGTTSDVICGSCHVLPQDVPAVASAKENRAYADDLLTAMRALTFSEFERFGAAVLRELGVRKSHISPHANDQGIDFYGDFSMGQLEGAPAPFFKLAHDVTFSFAGQAKHYPTRKLGPDIVRELVGAISLARTKTYSKDTDDFFEEVEIRPFSPLLALLFTTGEITAGASRLAEAAGVIARSGPQLALYLADRGVGIEESGGKKTFSDIRFRLWLKSPD